MHGTDITHNIKWFWEDTAILLHHDDDDVDLLHHYSVLVSFFYVVRMLPNVNEHLFQGKSFSGHF